MLKTVILTVASLFFLTTTGTAQGPDRVDILVHTSQGDRQHSAALVGQEPITVERAMQRAGVTYTATWFPNVPGYAAMIIDGDPANTTGGFESTFWWLCINGYSSAAGLQTLVKAGDQLEWKRASSGSCPKDSAR